MIIYVAGPFRGANAWEVERNIRLAEHWGFELAKLGHTPLIPHTMYRFWDGTLPDVFWLQATLGLLERCDAIFMCPGWRKSTGSKAELHRAQEIHETEHPMPVFDPVDMPEAAR